MLSRFITFILQKCLFMLRIHFLLGKIFQSAWRAAGARVPLDVMEICSYVGQAGSSQSQPCHCPPHAQCCLLSLEPEQSSWGQVRGRLEHHRALARKRDTHPDGLDAVHRESEGQGGITGKEALLWVLRQTATPLVPHWPWDLWRCTLLQPHRGHFSP